MYEAPHLMGITSLIAELSGESTDVTHSSLSSNKQILCSGSDDVEHISTEILHSLDVN
jgi:hypothetical protein